MRSFLDTTITIYRLTQSDDKSSYVEQGTDIGYLRPLSDRQSSLNAIQYGQGYRLIVENSVDIQVADKITIDSVDYSVKGVASIERGSVSYISAILIKGIKS